MKLSWKEPPEVILAREPLCFPNGSGGQRARKGTRLSQNGEGSGNGEA